jgi:hypothetical protein
LSFSYEPVTVVVERYVDRTVTSRGWVTKFRIINTVVRVIVTRITNVLLSPDGRVEVSRYVVPTRYVETEYSLPPLTQYVGLVRLEEPTLTTQPVREVEVAPTPAPAPPAVRVAA